jgi:hypothetical protein
MTVNLLGLASMLGDATQKIGSISSMAPKGVKASETTIADDHKPKRICR